MTTLARRSAAILAWVVPPVFVLGGGAGGASADATAESMAAVEAKVVAVAREATPKTVAIRVDVGGEALGFGSGAVISAEGLVLTCAHVTEAAAGGALVAVFPDGTEVPLVVVASNSRNDVSLCRIEPPPSTRKDLPHFDLAERDPRLGEYVVALGHPGGPFADHRPTVAVGKVTAEHRRLPLVMLEKEYVDAIQTDAPLYGGNSGGPLVDLDGRLAGINGAILLIGDAAFATPVSRFARDLPALRAGRNVEGDRIVDVASALMDLTSEIDPADLADAFADTGLGRILKGFARLLPSAGPRPVKSPRRLDDLKRAWAHVPRASSLQLRRNGVPVGLAASWGTVGGVPRVVTSARLVGDASGLTVSAPGTPDARPLAVRLVGRDGVLDLALLAADAQPPLTPVRHTSPGNPPLDDPPPPSPDPREVLVPGLWVLVPGPDGNPFQGGVLAALDREVGTDRRVPSLGILRLFKPSNTSPFRPYPKMIQIDCPLAADQFGGPVCRPDGSLVGIAVAHFNGGCTFVVPAKAILDRLPDLEKGIDVPAPPTYDPRRNTPSAALRAASVGRPSVSLFVPTMSGVPRRARFFDTPPSSAPEGPAAKEDSGATRLDVRAGDVLFSVGDDPTPDVATAKRRLDALADGATVRIGLMRKETGDAYRFEAVEATIVGAGDERRAVLGSAGGAGRPK